MLLFACFIAMSAQSAASPPVRLTSKRYELEWHGSRVEADEALRVLESAFDELTAFFGSQPKDPMRVRVFRDEKTRVESAWNDGASVPTQSQFASFSEETRTAYVTRIPGTQAARSALLYGACLQFHSLAKSKNLDIGRTWQASGLALDFSRHTWDGSKLTGFAMPRVESIDLPGKAVLAMAPLESTLKSAGSVVPALTWAVAAMCMHGPQSSYREAFRRYALGDTGSKLSTEDFLRTLGPEKRVVKDLREYLRTAQTPFEALGDWEDRGATAGLLCRGQPASLSFLVLREGTERLTARMSALPAADAQAGFVVGWYGPDDHVRIEVDAPIVLIHVVQAGKEISTMRLPVPGEPGRERVMEIDRAGSQYTLKIDGAKFTDIDMSSGRMGFYALGADVYFRDVTWR